MTRRILVHDYAGHPFQVQLSRELAQRGHTVLHLYSDSNVTPRGRLVRADADPESLSIRPISLGGMVRKQAFVHRWMMEVKYGGLLVDAVAAYRPDVVISGNTPLEAQRRLLGFCRTSGCRFVYWAQDLYGVAAHRILRRRLHVIGDLVGRYYMALERRLLSASDAVVFISDGFRSALGTKARLPRATYVIPNWAPIDELPPRPQDNAWARQHGLDGKKVLLYSGTLGMKHNPGLLLGLARHVRHDPNIAVVVISEGLGAEWLGRAAAEEHLENLLCLGFQPFENMPDVLGSAGILLAILEPDAGEFSVPSKVLTYLCAGRPVLAAIPPTNEIARLLQSSGAGVSVAPTDEAAFQQAADSLLGDATRCSEMGRRARGYAEQVFDVAGKADQFEAVFTS